MRNFLMSFVMLGLLTGCNSLNQEGYCLIEVEYDGFDHMTVADMQECNVMTDDNEMYYDAPGKFQIGDVVYSNADVETQRHNPVKVVPVPVTTTTLSKPTTITTTKVTTTTSSTTKTVDINPVKTKTASPTKKRR